MLNILLVGFGDQHNKMVAFADDITATGTLEALKQRWDHNLDDGPSYGYFLKPDKSWLIVKDEQLAEARFSQIICNNIFCSASKDLSNGI